MYFKLKKKGFKMIAFSFQSFSNNSFSPVFLFDFQVLPYEQSASLGSSYAVLQVKVTCDFQQFCILPSVDSDEPLQAPVKLRN